MNERRVLRIDNIDLNVYTNLLTLTGVVESEHGRHFAFTGYVNVVDVVQSFDPEIEEVNVLKALAKVPKNWLMESCKTLT